MSREKKEKGAEPGSEAVRYGAAVAEIEQILASIDRDEIDIDELSQKVERAVELLKVCRARLKATELRVTQVLQEVAAETVEEDEAEDEAESGSEEAETEGPADEAPDEDAKPAKPARRGRAKPEEDLPF
jgi:exodeoxyribonuclease VII small subunit